MTKNYTPLKRKESYYYTQLELQEVRDIRKNLKEGELITVEDNFTFTLLVDGVKYSNVNNTADLERDVKRAREHFKKVKELDLIDKGVK